MGHHLGSSEDEAEIRRLAKKAMQRAGLKGKPIENAIVDAFATTDPDAPIATDTKGDPKPDPNLRDAENVPLSVEAVGRARFEPDPTERLASRPYRELIDRYLADEVLPYVTDGWVDFTRTKIGYEVPITRSFYRYIPPRPLAEIDSEIRDLEAQIQLLLTEVVR